MSRQPALSVQAVSGGYSGVSVIRNVSLEVNNAEVLCVCGRNGVGKSTLARLVTGALTPHSGTVKLHGVDLTHAPPHAHFRAGIGYAPQENLVFDRLTVRENLTLQQSDRSLDDYEQLFAQFPVLSQRVGQSAGTLSGGEKKILSFCRAMIERTALVVLDEPSEGVQPENIALMGEAICAARASGRSFVVIEQNLALVEAVADTACLLDRGECVYTAQYSSSLRDELLQRMQI